MPLAGFLLALGMTTAVAQEEGGGRRPTVPSLFMKVEWVRPQSQADTKVRYVPVQANIADANVAMQFYGAAGQILTTGNPGNDAAPYGVWSGTADGPFAVTFKHKGGNLMDLSGLGYVRWAVKTSGFHVARPMIRVGGQLLVADIEFSAIPKVVTREFSLTNARWVKLDPNRLVTLNSGPSPTNDIWAPAPDLTKVEEFGFIDLMPGSGHGTGGWIQIGNVEIFAKSVAK